MKRLLSAEGPPNCSVEPEYVGILKVASEMDQEIIVNEYLERCLEQGKLPSASETRALFRKENTESPEVLSGCEDLSSYNDLFQQGDVK